MSTDDILQYLLLFLIGYRASRAHIRLDEARIK